MRDKAVSTWRCNWGSAKSDGVDLLQHELLQPGIGHHADPRAGFGDPAGARDGFFIDMHEPAADGFGRGDPDLGALQRIEESDGGAERGAVERQVDKALGQGLAAGQGDGARRTAGIVDDEAFQDVVDLVERHVEGERGIALDRPPRIRNSRPRRSTARPASAPVRPHPPAAG